MRRRAYSQPAIVDARQFSAAHSAELRASSLTVVDAAFAGVVPIRHGEAYDYGIRRDQTLAGLCFHYWEPWDGRFSRRFVRVKPDFRVDGKKYLQPVGERPKLYFIAGTPSEHLLDIDLSIFIVEGEKKALALDHALRELGMPGLVIGLGGVWGWRWSPRKLQPDGKLGKGRSQPIEELDRIRWGGRTVDVMFDSDAATNWKVTAAETALARELSRRAARVRIIRIPGDRACTKSV